MSDVETNFYGDTVECVNHLSGRRFVGSKSDHKKIRFLAGQAKDKSDTLLDYEQPKYSNVREQIAENQRLAGLRIPTHGKDQSKLNEPPRPRLNQRQIELLSPGNIRDQRQAELDRWNAYHSAKANAAERDREITLLAERTANALAAKQSQQALSTEIDDVTFELNKKWRADDAAIAKAKAEYETIRNDKSKSQAEIAASYQRIWDLEKASLTGEQPASETPTETPATEPAGTEGA